MTTAVMPASRPVSAKEQARRARFRNFMMDYYLARHTDLMAMEAATSMYAAEVRDWIERHGHPMYFKRWLILSRGMPR